MTERSRGGHRHAIGLTRRELLQVGYSGLLGMGVPSLWTGQATAGTAAPSESKAKSVVLIFLTGAPSHLDTFDLKPEAPVEIRGEFKSIATKAAGVNFCEHLPGLAARADKLAVIRSMTHGLPSHEHATHMMLTGIDVLPPGSTHMASRADWPCFASGLDFVRPRTDGIPSGVHLPTYLNNGYGFCGQNAGVLGPKFDPWQIKQDPSKRGFRVDDLIAARRPDRREDRPPARRCSPRSTASPTAIDRLGSARGFAGIQDKAFTMLTSGGVKRAFEIDREDPRLRDRYGRHMFGQSLLLTRRLIQAGVPIVQANMGHMNNWDTHTDNCKQLKTRLLPPLDQAVSAFLDDLDAHGLFDETLVVMVGEFGRTPKIGQSSVNDPNQRTGRDHWAGVFSALFAGGGVRGGQMIGRSDKIGAYPATRGYYPSDMGATIYRALGVEPASEVHDQLGRPLHLNRGEPIAALFDGTTA